MRGFLAALLWIPLAAAAEEPSWNLGGRIFSDMYVPTSNAVRAPFPHVATAAWLKADPKLNETTSAFLLLETNVVEASRNSASAVEVTLREAYAAYAEDGWDVRAGRQIIPWGKADAVNPTDFLSAKDYSRFNPDEEVKRIGATSLRASVTPNEGVSPFTFTGVWTPVFPKSRLLIPTASLPAGVVIGSSLPPANNLDGSELALKGAYNSGGVDFSLSAFRGWDHLPNFAFQSATPTSLTIGETFHRIHAFGMDFSKSHDDLVFRGEAAYVTTENDTGTNPLIQPTHLDAVLGVEKSYGDETRLQVQGIVRHHPKFTEPSQAGGVNPIDAAINRQIAAANALIHGYRRKTRVGATFRASYASEKSGWETELFALGYFSTRDYLLRPKITRAWSDAFKTALGADHYAGPESEQLGALDIYNAVFVEASYAF